MSVPISVIIVLIIILVILCFVTIDPKIYIFTLMIFMFVICGFSVDEKTIVGDGLKEGGKSEKGVEKKETKKVVAVTVANPNDSNIVFGEDKDGVREKIPKYNKPKSADFDKLRGYAVTKKLDGMRVVLYSNNDKLWAINDKGVAELDKPSAMPNGSIFDTEYYSGEFYIFDVMFIGGRDVRQFNLYYRMNCAARLEVFKMKEHIYTGDLQGDVSILVRNIDSKHGDIDGLIFTEINGKYDSVVYKAKPKNLMTIDFVIGSGGKLMVYLRKDPLVLKQFQNFVLGNYDKKYREGDVVECQWRDNHFEVLRRRDDKAGVPNHEQVARATLDQLRNPSYPATYDDMVNKLRIYAVGGRAEQIRKFHNTIKRRLVNVYCCEQDTVVFDIGIGRGGDIAKYKEVGVKKIIGVEPNKDGYIPELLRRSGNLGYKCAELTATNVNDSFGGPVVLWKNVGIEEFESTWIATTGTIVACSFFSLGFFFDQPDHIDKLISRLAPAKRFIGCTIDGQELRKVGKVKNEIFETTPLNKTTVKFHMNGDTTVQDQTEYYVDWPLFIDKMKEAGFEIVEDSLFSAPKYFNKDQQLYSNLYRYFVFERRTI